MSVQEEDTLLTQEEDTLVTAIEGQENAAYRNAGLISLENMLKLTGMVRKMGGVLAELRCAVDALTEENVAMRELLDLELEEKNNEAEQT